MRIQLRNIRLLMSITLSVVFGSTLLAQSNTNSPYTRFGYGKLEDSGFGRSQGMGGLSYGFRTKTNINPVNPAAYSSIDSTSFLFELGVSGLVSNFSTTDKSTNTLTGNLDYLALQFPVFKWMGISAGLIPYSFVGYNYGFNDSTRMPNPITDSVYVRQSQFFIGNGGISQAYIGLSFDLLDRLSLGVNAYYMFGSINHIRSVEVSSNQPMTSYVTTQTANLDVRNFNFRFGLQYHQPIGEKNELVLGGIYEFKSGMNGNYTTITTGVDTVEGSSKELFELPSVYGIGLTYTFDKRLIVGADFTMQEYAKAKYFGKTDSLNNRIKFNIGAEYTHDPRGMRYIDRMNWRLGTNYSNSYINVGGHSTNDFAITFGVGLPLRTNRSVINLNFEYGNIGTRSYSMIKEQYFKVGLNVSLNENWFFKSMIR